MLLLRILVLFGLSCSMTAQITILDTINLRPRTYNKTEYEKSKFNLELSNIPNTHSYAIKIVQNDIYINKVILGINDLKLDELDVVAFYKDVDSMKIQKLEYKVNIINKNTIEINLDEYLYIPKNITYYIGILGNRNSSAVLGMSVHKEFRKESISYLMNTKFLNELKSKKGKKALNFNISYEYYKLE